MAQQRLPSLVNAIVLLCTVQVHTLDVSEVPGGPAQAGTAPVQNALPAAPAMTVAPASQMSQTTATVEKAAPQAAPTAQAAAPTQVQASPARQPAASGGSQQAAAGAAQTAAAAAETAAEAAQTAAAAAASAAQSAAAAAGTPTLPTAPPASHVVSPVVQQIANMGAGIVSAAGPGPQALSAAAAMKAATSAASMEKTAAAAAASAASAAKVADTAAEAVTAHTATAATTQPHSGDDATKAKAAAIAAASAQKAADSAASAAASAASAAQAATTAEKTVTAIPSAPAAQAAVPPEAKPAQAAPSQPQAPGAASPGVQVAATVPVHVSEKELQHLPAQISAGYSFWTSSQWWMMQASTLASGLTFAMVVKALCVAGNVMVQVSPLPQVRRWELRQCTGEADAAPYVSIAFGGWQWCFYGLFAWWVTARSGFLILVHSNCLGAVLGSYYTWTFYCNCRNEEFLASLQKYLSAVTALALLQVCAMSVLPPERALFLTGLISSFCGFIGATSVLVTVPQVVRNKDSRSIPGPYACANFCSSIIWSLCGWMLDDPLVMVPSLFSTCCAMTALSCKALYPSSDVGEKDGLELEDGDLKQKVLASTEKLKPIATEFTPVKPLKATASKHVSSDSLLHSALVAAGDGTGGTGGC